jgi:hypothetical protein
MEIKKANHKGAESSMIRKTSGNKEYWFHWSECWFLEPDVSDFRKK